MRLPFKTRYQRGDLVVYCKPKTSESPGPRARNIVPAAHGETYSYMVDKFWVVADVGDDDVVVVRTRRGKELTLEADDPNLQHASLWQRILYRHRFPDLGDSERGRSHEVGGASG